MHKKTIKYLSIILIFSTFFIASFTQVFAKANPIQKHPNNPHIFLFRNKPTLLITSAEHYGAVSNLDFKFNKYLKTLKKHGFNYTRIIGGSYIETSYNNVAGLGYNNTLAPKPGRFISPWVRSNAQGSYIGGGGKFDLNKFNNAYFKRLKKFVRSASKKGIVVEVTLFCVIYDQNKHWLVNPMNTKNNINSLPEITYDQVYKNPSGTLWDYQKEYAEKMVKELAEFDNVFFEIMNEQYYTGKVSDSWTNAMINVVDNAMGNNKKMIALNLGSDNYKASSLNSKVSLLNLHYAHANSPITNRHLKVPIGFDETGRGSKTNEQFRRQGWEFIFSGGALFNHLDFSFAPKKENGTFKVPEETPGGGNKALRKQLSVLKKFIYSFKFELMNPGIGFIKAKPSGSSALALSEKDKQYAIYVRNSTNQNLTIETANAKYKVSIIDIITGKVLKKHKVNVQNNTLTIELPKNNEIAVSIKKVK